MHGFLRPQTIVGSMTCNFQWRSPQSINQPTNHSHLSLSLSPALQIPSLKLYQQCNKIITFTTFVRILNTFVPINIYMKTTNVLIPINKSLLSCLKKFQGVIMKNVFISNYHIKFTFQSSKCEYKCVQCRINSTWFTIHLV